MGRTSPPLPAVLDRTRCVTCCTTAGCVSRVGLAVVVAIPVAVLFYFQFRSLNALEETSAVVLRQLSGDTSGRLAVEIDEALKRPHIDILLRTQQGRLEPVGLRLDRRRCSPKG